MSHRIIPANNPFGHLITGPSPDNGKSVPVGHGRRIATLTRVALPDGLPPYFTCPAATQRGNGRLDYIQAEHVPADEVSADWEQAEFELERVSAIPWPYWRVVRRVTSGEG